ncbi:PREDICTED: poly [ADP-ribose] polymerase 2 isoform X1 [Erythranthe guttata]|uniref:poly [ADP-ribose] polymerase 2 isoform X1 n=1 Tax=Erythranthe guttata TaxID=4155 RepID=UPI00064DEAD3|nr:PREDICTED: poly [ADP-ribose] polymerase 2 isoform X1 [Erythranthe guttata]|eukprot:XP_012833645.1 PREDICTED: poly [ADP-ribose] polymerase 2 isoform X1 [Erythranthe guttata]
MATRDLKVEELRAKLDERGLSTAGIKPTLVRRLDAAIREEKKMKAVDLNSDPDSSRKRKRDSDANDSDSGAPPKIETIDELQSMNVKQLREKASIRGVSAAGTKKELIERLCADVGGSPTANDEGKSINSNLIVFDCHLKPNSDFYGTDLAVETKEENADSPASVEVKTVDELRTMNIKQLREEASIRGISTIGTKKELLERLCADNDNISTGKDPVKEQKEEKIVTATKKGSAVLDQWLPDHIKAQYHVLHVGDEIYDALLNQTNVGANNNKFFVIQILESDDGGKYMVYYRWGRVGVKGQNKLNGPYNSQQAAIYEFENKFFDKTKNRWLDRKDFVSYPRTYTWLEMDYSETKNLPPVQDKQKSTVLQEPQESKLEARIAKFISLICNMSMMRQQMMEIGYNADKLPLGKLSKSTILKGYDVLKRIADVIGQADRKTLEQLSGEFYTVIPHDFGFKKTSLFIIDTPQKLKGKLEMVEALGEIEVAMKLIENDIDMEDPLYSQYRRLQCELMPLEVHSEEFSIIEKYTKNTHAKTHSGYDVDIVQIFNVSREGEAQRFEKFSGTKNRMLLWHGSRLTNWTGILSQGLRIAPPEAPVTGYMFGKGVYFADMFSKSANYCCSTKAASAGVLLLCEVALGDMAELVTANSHADKLPAGKLSTKGVGQTAPDLSEAQTLENGVLVPLGKPKEQPGRKGSLLYNEYIVYNVDQIRMRYLVHVNFNFKY